MMLPRGCLLACILLANWSFIAVALLASTDVPCTSYCRDLLIKDLLPQNCMDFLCLGSNESGTYTIYPTRRPEYSLQVYCDQETDGGGWLVFQRRMDGSVNFQRNWKNYELGFGGLSSEFWLGNKNLALLTNPPAEATATELRIDLEDFDNAVRYAQYSNFKVGDKSTNYTLTVTGYSGDAGDAMAIHNGMMFSSIDKDHDTYSSACTARFKGSWWYAACHHSNLNGLYLNGSHTTYADGINWYQWRGHNYSLKTTEMKFRPVIAV